MQKSEKKVKLVQINTVCNMSTGHIMEKIQEAANKAGYDTLSLYGRRKGYTNLTCKKTSNVVSFILHVALTMLTDLHGLGSFFSTCKLISILRREKPNIIHLHNIHGYYLNYPLLFRYIKKEYKGKVFWTLHDSWPITGHCAFYLADCNKWKSGCFRCPHKHDYPISLLLDSSRLNYRFKRKAFTGVNNIRIIVPSEWLKSKVEQSFLKCYPVSIVHNGIDIEQFRPDSSQDIYKIYGIPKNRKILLAVSSYWNERKGLKDLVEISKAMPAEYVLVVVGISSRQRELFSENVIGISKTENVSLLINIYTAAYIFINPSVEETFSMVTVEAMACGVPVIVLDTSAVKELVSEETGIVLHNHNALDYLKTIKGISMRMEAGKINRMDIVNQARKYSAENMQNEVIKLYSM